MAEAIDLSLQKSVCKEIGFKEQTEKFRECVIKLYKREKENLNQATKKIEVEREESEKLLNEKRVQAKIVELQEKLLEIEQKKIELIEKSEEREEAMRQSRAIQAIIQSLSGNSNGPTASQEQEMCWHQCIDGGGFDNICRDVCY